MDNLNWIAKNESCGFTWDPDCEGSYVDFDYKLKTSTPESNSIIFRKEYFFDNNIASAKISICGLGLYILYIDGEKIGDYILSPLETEYRKRVMYDEFDVTEYIDKGTHTIAVELGNGRYCASKKYWGWRAIWHGDPCFTFELNVESADGTLKQYFSDNSWKCSYGTILKNCFYDGEVCDARLEQTGWNKNGFDDGLWQNAVSIAPPTKRLDKNDFFHLKKMRSLKPVNVVNKVNGKALYYFEDNISGFVQIKVKGERGEKIKIRYAERTREGYLDTVSNADAENTDLYILSGNGIEIYEPSFTFCGFCVVEITVENCMAEVLEVTAFHVYADVEQTGIFQCDNEKVQKLHNVILTTQKSALMSFPIDCPQRSERLGWVGDAHVTDLTCMYNFEMRKFYAKYLEDIALCVNSKTGALPHIAPWHDFYHAVDWSSGFVIILWDYYLFYRDTKILEKYCDIILKYVDYLKTLGPILPKTKYGDWMSTNEGWKRGDPECCASLYYYYDLVLLEKILRVINRPEITAISKLKFEQKQAILDRFYDVTTHSFDDNSQFSLSFALKLDLIPQNDVAFVVDRLVNDVRKHNYHLTTGILGTKYIMEVLRDFDRRDVAVKLILQDTYPGWLNLIDGKTTLSEQWDGGQSQNHCMFGSVDAIFYSLLAGIMVDETIELDPYFANEIGNLCSSVKFANGSVTVIWKREGDKVLLNVEIQGETQIKFKNEILEQGSYKFIFQ